jgi:hypothetical protein
MPFGTRTKTLSSSSTHLQTVETILQVFRQIHLRHLHLEGLHLQRSLADSKATSLSFTAPLHHLSHSQLYNLCCRLNKRVLPLSNHSRTLQAVQLISQLPPHLRHFHLPRLHLRHLRPRLAKVSPAYHEAALFLLTGIIGLRLSTSANKDPLQNNIVAIESPQIKLMKVYLMKIKCRFLSFLASIPSDGANGDCCAL